MIFQLRKKRETKQCLFGNISGISAPSSKIGTKQFFSAKCFYIWSLNGEVSYKSNNKTFYVEMTVSFGGSINHLSVHSQ